MDDIIHGPMETLDLHLKNGHPLESEHKESQSMSRDGAGKEERRENPQVVGAMQSQNSAQGFGVHSGQNDSEGVPRGSTCAVQGPLLQDIVLGGAARKECEQSSH